MSPRLWSSTPIASHGSIDDESDAFRHFVWAALLTKELGKARAKEFLDAHETDPDQPHIERQMDLKSCDPNRFKYSNPA